jgi:Tol biopolymer transport system component
MGEGRSSLPPSSVLRPRPLLFGQTALALFALLALCPMRRVSAELSPSTNRPRSPRLASVSLLQPSGARPRWAPDSRQIVFDRKNADGYYDLYVCDLEGRITRALTDANPAITQRNNGNGVYDPTGRFIVFLSEAPQHPYDGIKSIADPGVGLYCDLWATDAEGGRFWQLTHMPLRATDAVAYVNPHFSPDGRTLIWTERYAAGGHHNWGLWRIRCADFVVEDGRPGLRNQRVAFTPAQGNYVTCMGATPDGRWLLAGNLDGQHEYGMDEYLWAPGAGSLTDLLQSPGSWEEGAAVGPDGSVIFMSDVDSAYRRDFERADWAAQPRTSEYYLIDPSTGHREQLTWFNDPEAGESTIAPGRRCIVAALDVSPDGRHLAGTLGIDLGTDTRARIDLRLVLLEFRAPMARKGG